MRKETRNLQFPLTSNLPQTQCMVPFPASSVNSLEPQALDDGFYPKEKKKWDIQLITLSTIVRIVGLFIIPLF